LAGSARSADLVRGSDQRVSPTARIRPLGGLAELSTTRDRISTGRGRHRVHNSRICEHYRSRRTQGSIRQQREPLPLGQVAWCDYLEVAAVERGVFAQIEPFGKGDDAGVDYLEAQRSIGGEQLGHPPVIMWRHLDDPQLVVSYGGAEFRSEPRTPAPLRIAGPFSAPTSTAAALGGLTCGAAERA
jgi:hypothetical protein